MAKTSGLGQAFWVGGSDLSTDAQSGTHGGGPTPGDFTDITQSAHARQGLLRNGSISAVMYYDPTLAHPVLSALPTADVIMTWTTGTAIGTPAYCINAKQVNYDGTRATDGMYTFKVDGTSNAFGAEWGNLLTPGMRTDTAATNGTGWDGGNGFSTPSVPASGTPVTNTTTLPATVVVSGGTGTNVTINGVPQGTFDGTYTVPAGQAISLTYSVAPTWTWALQTAWGAQAYLHVAAFTGTDVTVTVQDSADGASYSNVASLSFTQVTGGAPLAQRIATSNTATIRRYLRAVTTTSGGFTSVTFGVAINRNGVAGVVF